MDIISYVNMKYAGNQAEFARDMGVQRQMVTQWIKAGFIVYDGQLYSPRKFVVPQKNKSK